MGPKAANAVNPWRCFTHVHVKDALEVYNFAFPTCLLTLTSSRYSLIYDRVLLRVFRSYLRNVTLLSSPYKQLVSENNRPVRKLWVF